MAARRKNGTHPLKAWRKAQKPRWWTQSLLAAMAGVSPYQVCRLELGAGEVDADAVARLSAYTGIPVADLQSRRRRSAAG